MNFRILGPIEVHGDDGFPLQLGKRMERSLLALLVLHAREVCSSDQLIDGLWPTSPPARADASLHSLIARLRRSLQPGRQAGESSPRLLRVRPGYQLIAEDDEIDARRFESLADQGRRLLDLGDAEGAHLQLAAALTEWRGPALAEFAYEPFADREAARLEERRIGVTEADLGARLAIGTSDLVHELEQCVAAYPLREHFWGYLLIALYRAGRQTDALRRADALRQTLAEVGLDPSPWIARIEHAILEHDPHLHGPEVVLDLPADASTRTHSSVQSRSEAVAVEGAPLHLPKWWRRSDHFVGREKELALLREAFARCAEGDTQIVAIVGEPGIGKSSLVFEAAHSAIDEGAIVLAGRCASASSVPFEPFVGALGSLLAWCPPEVFSSLGDHAGRLARLVPSQATRLGGGSETTDRGDDVEQYLLFEAVVELLMLGADRRPVVLAIDDLQWADESTLRLLDHLVRSDRLDRVLVIGTVHQDDLHDRASLHQQLDEWLRMRVASTIELGGLSVSELEALVDDGIGGAVDVTVSGARAVFVERLSTATGGNPYFAVEIVRGLAVSDAASDVPPALPESVQALVRTRLGRMSDEHRAVLEVAALVGPRIDVDLLTGVIGDRERVCAALDDATTAGLLMDREGVLGFRHDLVRTTLEATSGVATRSARHRAIGQALVTRHAGDLVPIADVLSHHFVCAAADGDAADAIRFSQLAGDAAVESLAFDTAITRFEAGIRAAGHARPTPGDGEFDLWLSLAEAWWSLGDLARAAQLVFDIIDRITKRGSLEQCRRAAWVFAYSDPVLRVDFTPSELVDRLVELERRMVDDPASSDEDLAVIGLALAITNLDVGEPVAASRILNEVLDRQSGTWSSETRVRALDLSMSVMGERRSIDERMSMVDDLLALLDERNDFSLEQRLQTYSAARWIRLTAGQISDVLRYDDLLEEYATRLRMPRYLAGIAQRRATLDLVRGRFAEAESHATDALEHRPDAEFFEGYVAQLAMIRYNQGRLAELLQSMDAMSENEHPTWMLGRALMWFEAGDGAMAHKLLGQFIDRLETHDRDISWLGSLALAVFTAYSLGAEEFVAPLTAELEPHRGRVALAGRGAVIFAPVDLLLAMLAVIAGELDEVVADLATAAPIIDALDADALWARAELVRAEALARAGGAHRAAALEHARAAVSLMDHLRMGGRSVERGVALLSELG